MSTTGTTNTQPEAKSQPGTSTTNTAESQPEIAPVKKRPTFILESDSEPEDDTPEAKAAIEAERKRQEAKQAELDAMSQSLERLRFEQGGAALETSGSESD